MIGKLKPFIRQEDCHMRLHGTVCFFKESPVYVEVSNDFPVNSIHITPLAAMRRGSGPRDGERLLIQVDNPDFCAAVPPLGYVNASAGRRAVFVVREPERRTRQGLSSTATMTTTGTRFRTADLFTAEFENMLLNRYPSFQDTLDSIKKGEWNSRAFHLDLAIGTNNGLIVLYFQGNAAAFYDIETETFKSDKENMRSSYIVDYARRYGGVPNIT